MSRISTQRVHTSRRPVAAAPEPFVSINAARPLLGTAGRPAVRSRILALGLRGELDIRQTARGHFVVMLDSIREYNTRQAAPKKEAAMTG